MSIEKIRPQMVGGSVPMPKVLHDKRGEIAYITLNRPPADVAEQVAPYVEAGCTTPDFIPFAARDGAVSDEAGIDAVAEVRQALGWSSRGSES
jgi:hypothetical protein